VTISDRPFLGKDIPLAKKNEEVITMSRAELKDVIIEAIEEAFVRFGVDVHNPLEVQADHKWVRDRRKQDEAIKRRGILTIVGLVVTAIGGAIWWVLKNK